VHSGACLCLLYYGGPLCATPLFPACRLTQHPSPDGLPPRMSCYPWSEPRSCECLRQCLATPTIVDVPQPNDRPFACFARRGAAPALQLSDFPAEGAAGGAGGAPRAGGAARAGRVPSGRGLASVLLCAPR